MVGFRRYPAGVQDFEEIREGGFVYVDKTRYTYDLAHNQGNAIFLSRPRRFGKSFLCSTAPPAPSVSGKQSDEELVCKIW
ncbi:MAG: AAA family ATPase [Muribaculaceae bacterium]|nr:AAA family ATPase [Muribaculaceae bacterium]